MVIVMRDRTGIRTRLGALAAAALLALAAGCGGSDDPGESGGTAAPTGNGQQERAPSPFTGEPVADGRQVLAVKVDNVAAARPPTGLEDADLVYVEQVEAGLSRLVAVYSSTLPDQVGPVRSARESDLELLEQFGEPALAYSGVNPRLRTQVADAPLYAVPPEAAPDAYLRSPDRAAPHNLFVRPADLLAAAPEASEASDIGFVFGDAPAGGEPTTTRTVDFPLASFSFEWDADTDAWLIGMDGSPATTSDGGRLSAATVVIQEVTIADSAIRDSSGAVTPYSETVGSGDALVLRDGRAYSARWERADAAGGTQFTDADGRPLPFATGPVWVVLADAG